MEKRIVLIGAGSAQFGFGTMGDLFQSEVLPGSHIVLHDINAKSLAEVEAAGQAFIAEHELPYRLSATTSRPEALQGADFCITSIEIGDRFELWEQDWRIPQQYGIRQVYGENGGPGGLFHSLRIIPPILEICADIERICPDAYLFNFSNPMSRICTTVTRRFPDLKLVGLCHEIASHRRHLPAILDLPFERLSLQSGGLNHFSVLLKATDRDTGEDLYPQIRSKALAYFDSLPGLGDSINYRRETGSWPDPDSDLKVDPARTTWPERGLYRIMLEQFGCLPITTDSHFGEYIQWAHDAVDHRGILDFYNIYKQFLSVQKPSIQMNLSERVVPIIEGILTDSGYEEAAVNLPNQGLIDGLPEWLVVEVPATVDKNGLHGIPLGQLPRGFSGLLSNQIAVHDLTAEAVLSKSREAVIQALLVDPIVDKYSAIGDMVDTMIELQRDHLGYIT